MSDSFQSHQEALCFEQATLGYGERVILERVNLSINKGQIVAVMGGSGSGKTTMLRAATRQIPLFSGVVRVLGADVAMLTNDSLLALRKRMGVLFQQGALFTDLSVFENVAFPLREHLKLTEKEVFNKVLNALDSVGLKKAAHLRTSEISGGMARRVALARTVIMEPELLLFDEPFAGLDPISLGVTAQLIRRITDQLGCASVLVTHDVKESFAIADYVCIVGNQTIVDQGTPDELVHSASPYVQQFLNGLPDGPVAFDYPDSERFQDWLSVRQGAMR